MVDIVTLRIIGIAASVVATVLSIALLKMYRRRLRRRRATQASPPPAQIHSVRRDTGPSGTRRSTLLGSPNTPSPQNGLPIPEMVYEPRRGEVQIVAPWNRTPLRPTLLPTPFDASSPSPSATLSAPPRSVPHDLSRTDTLASRTASRDVRNTSNTEDPACRTLPVALSAEGSVILSEAVPGYSTVGDTMLLESGLGRAGTLPPSYASVIESGPLPRRGRLGLGTRGKG
ncbi:hypothetical protein C8Q76DRAFT_796845 [Earliella scabrosa]|nr:hypothetical protein C8Q76DRAFT_796845 [Earliella scabrosa]